MNHVVLNACIAERQAQRYTPSGLPALDFQLEHESQHTEVGQARQVKLQIHAIAFGAVAERIAQMQLGSQWRFTGFLSAARNGRGVVLHVQDLSQE